MSTIVPITITASPLPSNFQGNPQQFMDAMVARLNVVTAVDSVAIVSQGAVAPTSNVGPWLKDGTTWYVWSTASGSYVPVTADPQTLKYVASITAPDWRVYDLWIQLNATGTAAIGIAYWDSAGVTWRNVYDSTFLVYNEQIATASTLYPFRGDATADTVYDFLGAPAETIIQSPGLTVTFAPNGGFASDTFTAPVGGYFKLDAKIAMEKTGGAPTSTSVILGFKKNGAIMPNDAGKFLVDNANLDVRNYSISSLVQLAVGDQITIYVSIENAGIAQWTLPAQGTFFSGSRVNAAV